MRVELGLSQRSLRRWQIELARKLTEIADIALSVRWSKPVSTELPSCVEALLGLEQVVHGIRPKLSARAEPTDLSPYVGAGGANPDLVIDLAGGTPTTGRRRWRLTFDGDAEDVPLLAALIEGRAPIISIEDADSGAAVANARPGIDEGSVAASFETILARTVSLIVVAVKSGGTPMRLRAAPSRLSCGGAVGRAAKILADAAFAKLSLTAAKPSHARTGWRFVTGPDVIDLGTHPVTGWRVLPDDGKRSYAQPFPLVVRGQPWLFVTERNFHAGKDFVSAVRFGSHGPLGTPAPVFELPSDVSHPHVFEADGNIWMIPQRSGTRSIDLYRATRFPGGWRHEASLVADVEASAPTPFRFGRRWWMIAAIRDGGTAADMLCLWSASDLHGPWQPHPANPVLIDAATAGSAGRVVERAGRLIRPIRHRNGHRRGLALAEIVRLDETSFEQRIVAEITNGPTWPSRGFSTLNRAGFIECIDGTDFSAPFARAAGQASREWTRPFVPSPQTAGAG